jgi:hypothetical protein
VSPVDDSRCGGSGFAAAQRVWDRLWATRIDKKQVHGVHGTLFCGLDVKKRFYPTERESEMITG